jgi:hypothetical protein
VVVIGGLMARLEDVFLWVEMVEVSVMTEVERRKAEGFLSFSAARTALAALAFSFIFSAAESCLLGLWLIPIDDDVVVAAAVAVADDDDEQVG